MTPNWNIRRCDADRQPRNTGAIVGIKRISLTVAATAALGAVGVGFAPITTPSNAAGVAVDQSGAVAAFYRSRGGAPLWFAPRSGAAAQQLVQLLATSSADNLDPRRYQAQRLARAVQAAQG